MRKWWAPFAETAWKASKHVAQGVALGGGREVSSPCKGKSVITYKSFCPCRAVVTHSSYPGRCPGLWAHWPFRPSLQNLRNLKTCHPPVTLVTLQKGCRRPVHRRSVTLTPYFLKNSILLSYSSSGFLPTPPPSPSTATKKGMSGDYWESPLRQQPEGKELVIDFVDAEGWGDEILL